MKPILPTSVFLLFTCFFFVEAQAAESSPANPTPDIANQTISSGVSQSEQTLFHRLYDECSKISVALTSDASPGAIQEAASGPSAQISTLARQLASLKSADSKRLLKQIQEISKSACPTMTQDLVAVGSSSVGNE